jgi:hypothetical protein
MRALLVLLALALLVGFALFATGFISIDQTRPAVVQAPKFQADVGRVTFGTKNETVAVPTVDVQKPGETPAPQTTPAP